MDYNEYINNYKSLYQIYICTMNILPKNKTYNIYIDTDSINDYENYIYLKIYNTNNYEILINTSIILNKQLTSCFINLIKNHFITNNNIINKEKENILKSFNRNLYIKDNIYIKTLTKKS